MNNVHLQMADNVYSQQASTLCEDSLVLRVSFTQCKYWNNLKLDQVLSLAA